MQRLAQLLRAKREEILEKWCQAVLADTNVPAAKTISTPALRDHVPQIVDAIIDALEGGLSGGEAAQGRALATSKMPRIHAEERFDEGYSLAALLRELSHLRASIVDAYWSEQPIDPRGVRFLHAALDECAAIAAVQLERASAAELEADRERLRVAVEVRDRFVAILSHDLRNPLNTIKMVDGLLLMRVPAERDLVAKSERAVERMRTMIEQLLDFTKVRGGALVLERAELDLGQVCTEIVEELRLAHPDRTIVLETSGPLGGRWDRVRIGQVVSNLLGNALAYSPRDTPVTVRMAGDDDEVVLSVHNEGEPIPAESRARIFEAFHRGDSDGENPRGIGLGLYIASEIVHAHGGKISVESAPDRGTAFTVRVPRR